MNKSRQKTTTETYTAHYNLSRTAEGPSLKGPFKTWNPQPHNLVSESETETVTKRHASHARTPQNVPSTHPAAPNFNYANHSLMSNSRTASSFLPHQRMASPALHRSDHSVPYGYPLEPPQTQQVRQKQNSSMLNFIRSHSNEIKTESTSSRRGDDLHRAAVTSSKQFQTSSNANQAARVPAPPVSYSSPSSTETSPRNSTDGHQPPSNNVSDGEFHRHHHPTGSKLNADYPTRRADPTSSSQRMADKKAKDRQDMVAKVTEALSPSSRPRVPENISLGQLSLLRGDDSNTFKRIAPTERTLESQYSRPQVYPVQPLPSQSQQRLHSQDPDPGTNRESGFKNNNRQQIINTMPRVAVDLSTRSQPTPVPIAPQSKPPPLSKTTLPPPPAKTPVNSRTQFLAHLLPKKNQSSSSRTAANPWPFNQASATDRGTSKQPLKEPPMRSSRTPTISNSANTQSVTPNLNVTNPVPVYSREPSQSNKAVFRNTGPPVPPKQTASNAAADRLFTEGITTRDLPLSVSKSTISRVTGSNGAGDQPGFPLPTPIPAPPSSSLWSSTQSVYPSKSKTDPNHPQSQPEQNPHMLPDADLQIKSPIVARQLSVKSPSKPTPSSALPIPAIDSIQVTYPATFIEQTTARLLTTPKSPEPSADLSLSLIPVETTVDHKLHERFPIQEYQALPGSELSPLFDDRDRLALVRPRVPNPYNPPTVFIKETASVPDKDPSPDAMSHKLPSARSTPASESQSHSGKSTPTEANRTNAPVHIQWIPPPESETSSLSSVEEDDIVLPKFTNAISQASAAAGVWTAPQKVVLRTGEMSYASQAHNIYVAPQKTSRSNPPTPSEPATLDAVGSKNIEAFGGSADVPAQAVTNVERPVAGAWTIKTVVNNSSAASTALEIVSRPSAKAFENTVPSSKSQEVARLNGSAVGMTPGTWNTRYINKSATIFESERTNESLLGNAVTASGQTMSSTMRQALNGSATVGAWTTKTTQPDHQLSQHSNANTTPKQTSRDTTPPSTTPKYQANPAAGSGTSTPSSSQSADHSNVGSGTSQVARVPISGHPSTPAPNRPTLRQTPPPLSISSTTPDTDSLLTPSSLNSPRSTLLITQPPPPPVPVTIYPPQAPIDKEKSSKSRILDFFRHSKPATTNISYDVWVPPREISKEKDRTREERRKELPTITSQAKVTTTTTNTIVPTQPQASSRPKSPKLFSPLKLFSKRNRTMSTASIDALDGTTTTVMNSPSSSAPDIVGTPYSPPVRDALLAAQEWRDNAANQFTRNKRPHRPGVTFDCAEDIAPIHMVPSRYKLSRSYLTEEDDI